MARRTIITDFHSIEETLRSGAALEGELLFFRKNPRIVKIIALAAEAGILQRRVSRETLEKKARGLENRGVLLLVDHTKGGEPSLDFSQHLESLRNKEDSLVLLLNGVTDPRNLGAILRSADLFAVDLVILPQRRSAHESPAVKVTSAGASTYVPLVTVPNLSRAMEELRAAGFWLYGAQPGGVAVAKIDFSRKIALILGSEGRGLGRLVSEGCDVHVSIPTGGHIDSLNVSVAAGILLYEVRRGDTPEGRSKGKRNSPRY